MWPIDIFRTLALSGLALVSLGAMAQESGASLLTDNCLICHASAEAGLYPRLNAVADELTAEQLAMVILNGKFDRAGEVDGQTVPVMPAHARLSNESIAAIVNELQADDSARAGRLTVERVAQLRGMGTEAVGPPLAPAERAKASRIYHNQCAGCHAVDRSGRAGSALYTWAMQQRGMTSLMATLHLGSTWGMPAWGDERLAEEDLELLARYLQQPLGELPRFEAKDLHSSWQQFPPSTVARRKAPAAELFVTLLHDTGQIGLIDGANKQVLAVIDTGLAPHDIALSADGCRLAVLSRSADVALVDLCLTAPAVIARVKVGFEGRALGVLDGRDDELLVGSYWPPQLALLNGKTLRPEQLILLDEQAYETNATASEVAQVLALGRHRALALTKEAGEFILLERGKLSRRIEAPAFLRAGSRTMSQRYLVVPTDDAQLVVLDLEALTIRRTFFVPGFAGGGRGAAYSSGKAAYWIASAMGPEAPLVRIRTDGDPQDWWVEVLTQAGDGSLNAVTHPLAAHLWVDHPLAADRARSQAITLVDKADFATEVTLPIVAWAGLADDEYARALHPQFSADGSEVWVTVWNRQDYTSAIVVVDAKKLRPLQVIKDPRLTTAIRTFSLAQK